MYFGAIINLKEKRMTLILFILFMLIAILSINYISKHMIKYYVAINENIHFSVSSNFEVSSVYSRYNNFSPYLQSSSTSSKTLIDVKSIENGIEFSYPSIFKASELTFPGSEIVYHVALESKENKNKNGFVQVWNMPYPLENFLNESKESSTINFIDFIEKKITVNNLNGYFWEYTIPKNSGNYKALEVFIQKGSKLYRISYFFA